MPAEKTRAASNNGQATEEEVLLLADEQEAEEVFDPFDVDALRANPPRAAAESMLLTVPVRKPSKTEFFRVNADPAFIAEGTIIEYESDTGRDDYFVPPAMRKHVGEEMKPVCLFVCVNTFSVRFLWPARMPTSEFGRRWQESALRAADLAKTTWVRMIADRGAGGYNVMRATGDLGEPEWGEESFAELLKLGFGAERVITGRNHPVLRKLRGED